MDKAIRILVVDDDPNIRDTIGAILMEEGYLVDFAENGLQAIEKSKIGYYNIALLDIRLPDIAGVELLTRIEDTVPRMRKIMVTGFPSVDNAIEAVNRKADAYLVKPVDIAKLLRTIRSQLELQEAEKEFDEQKVANFIEARIKEISRT